MARFKNYNDADVTQMMHMPHITRMLDTAALQCTSSGDITAESHQNLVFRAALHHQGTNLTLPPAVSPALINKSDI